MDRRSIDEEDVLRQYQPLAVGIALEFRDREELGDLITEALVALWDAYKDWDPMRGVDFGSYAAMRIRHKILKHLNRRCALIRTPEYRLREFGRQVRTVPLDDLTGLPEAAPAFDDDGLVVQMAIDRLGARDGELVRGYYCGGLTQKALARRHGMGQMTVSKHLRRSRARLREILGDEMGGKELDSEACGLLEVDVEIDDDADRAVCGSAASLETVRGRDRDG